MSNNIYEQAIADAKKLREVAEQNAKNAIIEAITPRVRELIDNELTHSYSDETISESYASFEDSDDDIILEESAILELAKEITGSSNLDESNAILEILSELEEKEEEDKKVSKKEKDSDKEIEESNTYETYEQNEDDMNLDELLNEIKMEIDLDIPDKEMEEALLELMPTIKIMADEDEEGEEELEAPEESELEDEEEDSEGDAGGEDLNFELPPMGNEMDAKEEADEMYSINESLLEAELLRLKNKNSRNEESTNETSLNESRFRQQILQEKRQNTLLKGKLDEYRGAIETLRDQLNEMNLFNAKLLYVNKLLQTKGLGSSQKKTIIESIDNAESLREVKLVYKTLSESVAKTSTNSLNESKIRKLASSSSRPTKSGSSLLNESKGQVNRWAKLAGLK